MRLQFVGIALALGCSEASINRGSGDAGAPVSASEDDGDATTTASPPAADTGESVPDAAYYAIDLDFDIAGTAEDEPGTWLIDTAKLSIHLWSGEPALVCTQGVPVVAVTEEPPPDTIDVALFAWWRVGLGEGTTEELCPAWPARTWWLGLGPYDTRLDPMLAERGMLAFDVYGLYLRDEAEGPVYVVGFAGTNEMVAGEPGLTVDAGPLPDGQYQGESLVLMTLP
jgi:hypothetical protein